jgi:hypothetical protein
MNPYFYKIKHLPSGKYYIGSQYGKNSDPSNLWNSYTTSSKYVQELIESTGKDSFRIIKCVARLDAKEYEAKFLKRLYKFFGKYKFLSVMINRNVAPGILLTPETIKKANAKRKVSNSIAAKKLFKEGRHNFQKKPASQCPHVRKLKSDSMMGNNYGSFRNITEELKKVLSEKSKGNTNVRGTKWWYNESTGNKKRCIDSPGDGWVNKCPTVLSEEGRLKISKASSKPKTAEHRKKLSELAKSRVEKGTHNFLKKEK